MRKATGHARRKNYNLFLLRFRVRARKSAGLPKAEECNPAFIFKEFLK
jgi:hypothetical protein